jgi:hypothetical protein
MCVATAAGEARRRLLLPVLLRVSSNDTSVGLARLAAPETPSMAWLRVRSAESGQSEGFCRSAIG